MPGYCKFLLIIRWSFSNLAWSNFPGLYILATIFGVFVKKIVPSPPDGPALVSVIFIISFLPSAVSSEPSEGYSVILMLPLTLVIWFFIANFSFVLTAEEFVVFVFLCTKIELSVFVTISKSHSSPSSTICMTLIWWVVIADWLRFFSMSMMLAARLRFCVIRSRSYFKLNSLNTDWSVLSTDMSFLSPTSKSVFASSRLFTFWRILWPCAAMYDLFCLAVSGLLTKFLSSEYTTVGITMFLLCLAKSGTIFVQNWSALL